MDPDLKDLLPLFLAETRERLERLAVLLPRVAEAQIATEVRRELHTIKGAARMLQLASVADLAHSAEGLADRAPAERRQALQSAVDALANMVEAVARGEVVAAGAPAAPTTQPAAVTETPAPGSAAADLRVDPAVLEALAERAMQLRILAMGAGQMVSQTHELALLAARGVDERPEQVLPMLGAALRRLVGEMEQGQRRLQRVAETHLEALLELQLQPLRGFLLPLARHARELAHSLGREVEVTVEGEETRLDRRIARELEEALLHILRNAVDHGIEPPVERAAMGKSRRGTVRVRAFSEGRRVRLVVADDGRGIDADAVRRKAVERGLIDAPGAERLRREEALRLVCTPGFSTRDELSEVSGRGTGLDVVVAAAARVGGEVLLDAAPGAGCTVTIDVPLTRRGEQIVVVRAGATRAGIPANAVRRYSWLEESDVVERGGLTSARLEGTLVPFVALARLFGQPAVMPQLLLHLASSGQELALAVDAMEHEEEVILRPVPVHAETPLLDGLALLASGEPLGVLSLAHVAQAVLRVGPVSQRQLTRARRVRVLLVEDSLVTREMERRLLEDAGFEVATATDASDALATLTEGSFDCVVTDVEMPGMDGYELTRRLRSMPHLANLPVIVLSTRDRAEDRLAGLAAGADAYLTKQSLDAGELISLVRRLGGA